MPRGIPLGKPSRSFCPTCKHTLGLPDLFPLLSWLFLRGRCRHCGARVASRYFFVELLAGGIWAAIWYRHLIASYDPAKAAAFAAAASVLVAIVFIDWELYIIPDELNASLWAIGIAYNVALFATGSPEATTWGIPSSLAGWIVGVLALWGIALFGRLLFGKDAMGHGDIKMARGIGAVVFVGASLMSFGVAVILGAVLGIVQILVRGKKGDEEPAGDEEARSDDDDQPESIGSLLKCGLGYLLCIDILGLFIPKLYESWFGEPPSAAVEEVDDEFPIEHTMIPFGPYLAMGAIGVILFRKEMFGLVEAYQRHMFGPP